VDLLALDFDGVISDSAPESWLVALRTYADLRPAPKILALRDRAEGQSGDAIRADPAYARFLALMPLGNRAEDFGVAVSLVAAGRSAPDQASFDEAYASEPDGFLPLFHETFYQSRARIRADDPVRWTSLLGPYPGFVDIVRRRAADVRMAIATAKDRTSVELLLRDYDIEDLFDADAILDKEAGRSKRAHLATLHQRFGVDLERIVFVDDKVNHLDDVAGMGVSCVLAAWGYNGEREHRLARTSGHRVCTLSDFEEQLF
jgi:phosphoglycolate phosphatase-like HAD superfamily hydrolase